MKMIKRTDSNDTRVYFCGNGRRNNRCNCKKVFVVSPFLRAFNFYSFWPWCMNFSWVPLSKEFIMIWVFPPPNKQNFVHVYLCFLSTLWACLALEELQNVCIFVTFVYSLWLWERMILHPTLFWMMSPLSIWVSMWCVIMCAYETSQILIPGLNTYLDTGTHRKWFFPRCSY